MDRKLLEEQMSALPIVQYDFLKQRSWYLHPESGQCVRWSVASMGKAGPVRRE